MDLNIPIVIICYNNHIYVENTVNQILKINKNYYKIILILDNCSTFIDTINYLKNVDCKVIYNNENVGPWITSTQNKDIYDLLPDKFILTDPDLEFNENLPDNFIEILSQLSDKYKCNKVGFALDIRDFDKMYNFIYFENNTIYDWEKRFWYNKINHEEYELYWASIDTTFCLVNKLNNKFDIRVAGNFTAKHLPWYINNKLFNLYETYLLYNKTNLNVSSISTKILKYIDDYFLKINKNQEIFLIRNNEDDANLHFWKNIYKNWDNDKFNVFDKFLDKNKIFIDIGGWIGTTCMYGSRNSKHVYSIEADNKSFEDLSLNCQTNCKNYTLINKAIYNVDNIEIKFGKNKFMNNSKINDSTSQIYTDEDISNEYYKIQTITLQRMIEHYNINPREISLIKVDIEGGEEYIINDLYNIYKTYSVPLYISFHYDWWQDKNLDRFEFLTEEQKNNIINSPFISLLICN
jgi:FkbM family methyltransferase